VINSSIVTEKATRSDIRVLEVPAVEMAQKLGNEKAANMVILGAILEETGVVSKDTVREEMRHMFSGRKEKFLPMNLAALDVYSKE
ncbi:MAG: 2-oxoacid:acceptor oxidoreductase family protein, partial [Oscillospiraceae bacterium]|nr:2-oxoacid:acceptor oxidoreductase family protein [Oscillospiraceae bacterium]